MQSSAILFAIQFFLIIYMNGEVAYMNKRFKKILSLMLAAALAIGLCITASGEAVTASGEAATSAGAGAAVVISSSGATLNPSPNYDMEVSGDYLIRNPQLLAKTSQIGIFKVTHPVGGKYNLNATATPMSARFQYDIEEGLGRIDNTKPVKVQWYWSTENSNASRANGLGETTVEYDNEYASQIKIDHKSTHTPATDVLGVKYYYAVLTYVELSQPVIHSLTPDTTIIPPGLIGQSDRIEIVTDPARIEVVASLKLRAKKTDEDGNPLAGAVLVLAPQDDQDEQDVQEKTTGADGYAEFSATDGEYTISEKQAPDGYVASGLKYYIKIEPNKYSVDGSSTSVTDYAKVYDTGTFINEKIPASPTPTPVATPTATPAPPADTDQSFEVKKTDGDGKPLSGAILTLVPDGDYDQDATKVKASDATVANGTAKFTAAPGYYILSEKQAPAGYNATDEKFYILVAGSGVFLLNPATKVQSQYSAVTFVNKEIPALDKDNHFAFMQGYPEGDFRPENNMTRAEATVMFSRLLSKSMNESADHRNNYYPDVPSGEWYANQVGYMQELGVLADYSRDGRFRPDDSVTRAEFATLAAHFDNLTLTDTNSFSDVPANHWAVKYINSAAAKGWITGYPDGTFKPESNITRAEVVTLVGRMLDRYADNAYLTANASSLPRNYNDLNASHWAYLMIMEASTGHDYSKDGAGEHWTSVTK